MATATVYQYVGNTFDTASEQMAQPGIQKRCIRGNPIATSSRSVEEMLEQNMVGLYLPLHTKEDKTARLELYLRLAKRSEENFKNCNSNEKEIRKSYRKTARNGWRELYELICVVGKVDIVFEDGETCQVRSIGLLTDDLNMLFSSNENPESLSSSCHLKQIATITAIDEPTKIKENSMNDNLNELLETAKNLETQFLESQMSNHLHEGVDTAWQALYKALVLQGQFDLIRDGEIDRVRTIGILYNGHSLSYSEAENSQHVFSGTNLMAVKSIEELT